MTRARRPQARPWTSSMAIRGCRAGRKMSREDEGSIGRRRDPASPPGGGPSSAARGLRRADPGSARSGTPLGPGPMAPRLPRASVGLERPWRCPPRGKNYLTRPDLDEYGRPSARYPRSWPTEFQHGAGRSSRRGDRCQPGRKTRGRTFSVVHPGRHGEPGRRDFHRLPGGARGSARGRPRGAPSDLGGCAVSCAGRARERRLGP